MIVEVAKPAGDVGVRVRGMLAGAALTISAAMEVLLLPPWLFDGFGNPRLRSGWDKI